MNVAIQIHYEADLGIKSLQRGSFPARGRKPEKVALDWWKELKREMNVEINLEKVIVDGKEITDIVKQIENFEGKL